MAEINNVIAEASQDLQTIEDFVNLPAGSDVRPRLLPSVNVGTLAGARQAIFENGGLPATPFATKALMTASSLADGQYAMVTDETANNGLYVKTAGAWIKSAYDPLAQSKTYTDSAETRAINTSSAYTLNGINSVRDDVNKKVAVDTASHLHVFLDVEDRITAYIDKESSLHLTGIDGSVQDNINTINNSVYGDDATIRTNKDRRLLDITDADGNVFASFNHKSELMLTGSHKTVQSVLNDSSLDNSVVYRYIDSKFDIPPKVYPYIMNLSTFGKPIAPMPFEYTPLSWSPDNSIINLKVTDPAQYCKISTPYDPVGEGRTVHPTVFQCRDTFVGYKYILGITPYALANALYENPMIYGSNDLQSFEYITDFPIADVPMRTPELTGNSYNSDIFFTYDYQTGELLCGWREVQSGADGIVSTLIARRTKNLVDWGEYQTIYEGGATKRALSPSIVYNFETKMYDLYTIEARSTSTNNPIRRLSSPSLQNPVWTNELLTYPPLYPTFTPWHIDVRYLGDKLLAVMHMPHADTGNLWTGISSDNGDTWAWAESGTITGTFIKPYKATVLPVFTDKNKYHLQYIWTTLNTSADANEHHRLMSASTQTITIL